MRISLEDKPGLAAGSSLSPGSVMKTLVLIISVYYGAGQHGYFRAEMAPEMCLALADRLNNQPPAGPDIQAVCIPPENLKEDD